MKNVLFVILLTVSLKTFGQSMSYLSVIGSVATNQPDTLKKPNKDSLSCKLERIVDEFDGKVTYNIEDEGGEISFIKIIRKGLPIYYLRIWIKEDDIYTGKGVTLILEDGKKISKPMAEVDYELSGDSFYATTFIQLTPQDIALLKQSGIQKYRLYIVDGYTSYSRQTKDLFNCLIKSK